MTPRTKIIGIFALFLSVLFVIFLALNSAAEARGKRGGGGFSRHGSASHGTVRSNRSGQRTTRQGNRSGQRSNRQDNRGDRYSNQRDTRQDRYDDRRDFRRDAYDDRRDHRREVYDDHREYHEYYEDRWKRAAGAALTVGAFRSLSCSYRTVVVGGVTYYDCSGTWYQRGYQGSQVVYVVVAPPPGH